MLRSGKGFCNDFDLLAAVGAGNVEGAEDERFAGNEDGGAVQRALMEDRVLHADAGLLICNAGLRDLGAQTGGTFGIAVQRGLDLQPYVLVLDIRALGSLAWGSTPIRSGTLLPCLTSDLPPETTTSVTCCLPAGWPLSVSVMV